MTQYLREKWLRLRILKMRGMFETGTEIRT